jgi:hypothetical protein
LGCASMAYLARPVTLATPSRRGWRVWTTRISEGFCHEPGFVRHLDFNFFVEAVFNDCNLDLFRHRVLLWGRGQGQAFFMFFAAARAASKTRGYVPQRQMLP